MTYLITDPVVISSGNSKIGKIPNVSLPPILSCPKGVPCASEKLCYSLKAWRMYPSVRDARLHNWKIWLTNPHKFFKDISDWLTSRKTQYFRFHVDGDIPNESYFNNMKTLADKFPKTRFLAFTKHYSLLTNTWPSNLTIIPSAWPGFKIPAFPQIAWMEDGRENRYMHANFDCNKSCDECFACWHLYDIGKDVVFQKH